MPNFVANKFSKIDQSFTQPTKIDNRQEDTFRGRLSNDLNPKN